MYLLRKELFAEYLPGKILGPEMIFGFYHTYGQYGQTYPGIAFSYLSADKAQILECRVLLVSNNPVCDYRSFRVSHEKNEIYLHQQKIKGAEIDFLNLLLIKEKPLAKVFNEQGILKKEMKSRAREIDYLNNLLIEKQNMAEIRKSARLFAQGYRNPDNFAMEAIPLEVAVKIAAFATEPNIFSQKEAEKIAISHWEKPFETLFGIRKRHLEEAKQNVKDHMAKHKKEYIEQAMRAGLSEKIADKVVKEVENELEHHVEKKFLKLDEEFGLSNIPIRK